MAAITTPTDPKKILASVTANVTALDSFSFHVKTALHIDAQKVYNLMLKNRIREFREKREMTQTELAIATEVTRQTIHSIENKNVVPTVEIAIRLANAMSAKVEELFIISKIRRGIKRDWPDK